MIRLDRDNYLLWKNQLLNVIIANDLEDFVDGSRPQPPKFLENQQQVRNPQYTIWQRFNRLLMSWFCSSLSEAKVSQIVGYQTAYEIWVAWERSYASNSRSRLIELQTEIQNLKKGSLPVDDYVQKKKAIANKLVAIGEPISHGDLIIYILQGLGSEYNPFVTMMESRVESPTSEELHNLLLNYDSRLQCHSSVDQLHDLWADLAALSTNRKISHPNQSNFRNQKNNFQQSQHPFYPKPKPPNYQNPYRVSNSQSRVLGKPTEFFNSKKCTGLCHSQVNCDPLVCQLYEKIGHATSKCYHRTNLNYQPKTQLNAHIAQVNDDTLVAATLTCSSATPSIVKDNSQYMDSGASHHLSSDSSNMSNLIIKGMRMSWLLMEAFVDPQRDESVIVELVELKHEVPDEGSSIYFLENLAKEQDAEGTTVIEQTGLDEPDWLQSSRMSDVVTTTAVAQMEISKGRQGRDAQNILKVFIANLRLKSVNTDVLITAYEPLYINPLSESAGAVGAGPAIIATQSGCVPMNEVFKKAVCSFEVKDWSLFDPK